MIGPVIWQANESDHYDLSTAVQSLRRDVDKRQPCYLEEFRHAGTTCNWATAEEHVQRQVVQAKLVAKKSSMRYHPNGSRKYGPMT